MIVKMLELRDRATFIPVVAVQMSSDDPKEDYLLRRAGYPAGDFRPLILLTRAQGRDQANHDPYNWEGQGRTWKCAHQYMIEHWNEIQSGDVIDVQFVLGETPTSKLSERETAPC